MGNRVANMTEPACWAQIRSAFWQLPQKMAETLHPETVDGVISIWKGFEELYTVITNWSPDKNPTELWIMAKDWVKLFLQ